MPISHVRLFFAVWPDVKTRENLGAVIGKVPACAGRMVSKDKLHITLLFLGRVSPEQARRLTEAAGRIRAGPFSLTIDKPGWWPRPKVLWLGVSVIPPELLALVNDLRRLAADLDLPVDSRPYEPHITYARKAGRPVLNLEFAPIDWDVREFCLVASDTCPDGAEYKILQRWSLAG